MILNGLEENQQTQILTRFGSDRIVFIDLKFMRVKRVNICGFVFEF